MSGSTKSSDTADGKFIGVLSGRHLYGVAFQKGRLSFADRTWNGKGTSDLVAVIGALTQVAKDNSLCRISHQPLIDVGTQFLEVQDELVLLTGGISLN